MYRCQALPVCSAVWTASMAGLQSLRMSSLGASVPRGLASALSMQASIAMSSACRRRCCCLAVAPLRMLLVCCRRRPRATLPYLSTRVQVLCVIYSLGLSRRWWSLGARNR